MKRRAFIHSTCNMCLLASTGFLLNGLEACSTSSKVIKAAVVNNTVSVPTASFATSGLVFVRPGGWFYDIAVQKKNSQQYEALLMECTHQQNQLTHSSNGFTCSLHGSEYTLDGVVTKGPAERPLKHFTTSIQNDQLIINLI